MPHRVSPTDRIRGHIDELLWALTSIAAGNTPNIQWGAVGGKP